MKEYLTPDEYKKAVVNMPFDHITGHFEFLRASLNRNTRDTEIMNILESEIERRFLAWEACEV